MAGVATPAAAAANLALHFAVWDDNSDLLAKLLLKCEPAALEAKDRSGNTPLLLAYRLGRVKCARMLLAANAFPKPRTPEGWEAIQVAGLTANPDLVRTAVTAYLAETDAAFSRRLPTLLASLESLPDFSMQLSWQFSSWVPLLGRLLPSDQYGIYKRGSSLRLDTTLLGMNGLSWERGSVSLLLCGSDSATPGAMFVMDNEMKTAADARLAFTHPQDVHIQDWVRKLLTQKQKNTDYWARDVVMLPLLKQGVLGGLFSKAKALVSGPATPRGRISEGQGDPAAAAGAAAEDGSDGSSSPAVVHVDNANQIREDAGGWPDCVGYQMCNFCVRDLTHTPVLQELKLQDWWKPEYSKQATDAQAAAVTAASAASASSASTATAGPGAAGGSGGEVVGDVATAEAPEKLLRPLQKALRAIRLGKINESNASSATLEQLEGMGFDDDAGKAAGAGSTVTQQSFEDYFGVERAAASAEEKAEAEAVLAAKLSGGGSAGAAEGEGEDAEAAAEAARPAATYVHTDGRLHKPAANVCVFKPEAVTQDDKVLDLKVFFSKDFPITTEQFLPIAEVMARTSRHAENIRRFFSSKMPTGAGFPVRFNLPVFPTIQATITFELCDTRRSPPKSFFEVPADYKMGAYVERGFIRQL